MNRDMKLQYIPLSGTKRPAHQLENDQSAPVQSTFNFLPSPSKVEVHIPKRRRHSDGTINPSSTLPQTLLRAKRRRPPSPETHNFEVTTKKLRYANECDSSSRSSAPPTMVTAPIAEPSHTPDNNNAAVSTCTAIALYDGTRNGVPDTSNELVSSFPEIAWMQEKIRSMGSEFYVGCDRLTHTLQMGGNIKNVYEINLPLDGGNANDDAGSVSDAVEEYDDDMSCMMIDDDCKVEDVDM